VWHKFRAAAVKVIVTMRSVSIRLCGQGQLAEWDFYCVGYNVLEQSVLGQYIVNLIHISWFEKAIHYCINYKERWRTFNLNFNVSIFICKFVFILLIILFCYKPYSTTPCMFPNSLPNHKYHINLQSEPHIELCFANYGTQDMYWVADIDFWFADINRFVAAFKR
jgi:hypothetical protein